MTSVGITPPGATTSTLFTVPPPAYQQAVVLDSGSSLSTLPADLVTAMLAEFTGVISLGSGFYSVDCNQTSLSGTLDFGFGNTVINVPYHQFIWVTGGTCIFGAIGADPTTYDTWILGGKCIGFLFPAMNKTEVLLSRYCYASNVW
jgi:Eukaryotic aspartyl protease